MNTPPSIESESIQERKVVALATRSKTTNEQAVQLLQEMLEMAKRGDLEELYAICKKTNGDLYHYRSGCNNLMEQLAYVSRMVYNINKRIDQA